VTGVSGGAAGRVTGAGAGAAPPTVCPQPPQNDAPATSGCPQLAQNLGVIGPHLDRFEREVNRSDTIGG